MKQNHRRPARTMVRAVFMLLPFVLAGGALALSLNLAAAIPPAQGFTRSTSGPDVLFTSPEPRHSQAAAWGDVDGDGDLDLAMGNGVFPMVISWLDLSPFNRTDQLYINDGRGQFAVQDLAVEPQEADDTRGLAWGDWDGDGDLDLAVANGSDAGGPQPNLVYENDGGVLGYAAGEAGPGWLSAESRQSSSTGWGDWDGDGDLDLAFGNEDAPNQVYENISNTLRFDPANGLGWEAPAAANTSSMAWGDWDGDGDLDLAFGNYGDANLDSFFGLGFDTLDDADGLQVYENISGTLQIAPESGMGWSSGAPALVQAIAWGDWDGDGDLDLAAGGGSRGNERGSFLQVWENDDGVLAIDPTNDQGWELIADGGLAALSKPAALAWADWNRDGDLDLIVANNAGGGWGRRNQIYENVGGALALDPRAGVGWQSTLREDLNSETTFAVAAGDADGDGDPDVAFANGGIENGGQVSLILRNQTPVIGFHGQPWESADARASTGAAWGDWDGDGDLDLAVSNEFEPLVVYENVDGRLGWDPALALGWEAPISHTARSADVAWGDWDGDGDLDLAVANDGAPDAVYENEAGSLALDPAAGLGWQSVISDTSRTRAVAWGDWDSDGDLDLALGKDNDLAQVLENEGGTLLLDPARQLGWASPAPVTAQDVAWGDWDDDGDLDLALGARVYENEDGDLLLDPDRGLGFNGLIEATSVAWGDVDGDGDLDLAAATDLGRTRVYENSGGQLLFSPRADWGWESNDFMRVRDLAWGDADGDGDLDLATANATNWGFEPNQIFENADGQLSPNSIWETTDSRAASGVLRQSQAVAWGDVDGDGDLDLAYADYCTANDCPQPGLANQVYYNTLQRAAGDRPALAIPLPNVIDPDDTATANFYASPDIVSSNVISIPYRLAAASGSTVGRVEMFYSLDGGDNWQPARPTAATQTTNLASSAAGTNHVFGWDTFGSDFFGRSDNVVMQLVVYQNPTRRNVAADGTYRYFNSAAGSFERPAATASTFPFRVQSTQIQVISGTTPVQGAWVYRLPANQIDGALLMPDPVQPQTTNDQGYLPGGGLLQPGDRLVAVVPAPAAPVDFSSKVRLFYTSAPAAEAGLDMTSFEQPGIVSLTISRDNPLLLFDVDVSLEWDARNDPTFLAGLTNSFQRASEILYDTTNGQAALGVVQVFQNKELWGQADVVVLANNAMRPSAAIGGIAKTPLTETVRVGLEDTKVISGAYNGGQIRMGTVWDPYGENTAELGEEWWRALAHELAHYLLFLPDNYLGFKDGNVLGRINCQGSFMTSTYDPAYSEFLIEDEWVDDCRQSLAERTTGRTDWETIGQYYPMLQPPAAAEAPFEGPAVQPLALTDVVYWPPQEGRTVIAARNYDVRDEDNERLRLPAAQAYLFQTQGTDDPTDDMLVALGGPTGGGDRLKVRGAYPGDRLCLIESSAGQAYIGCDDNVQPADVSLRVTPLDPAWRPEIAAQSVTSRTVQITVTQPLSPGEQAYVQLFPLHYWSVPNFAGLSPTATLQTAGDVHTATLTMTLPAYDVAVRVWTDGAQREAITHFTLNPPWPAAGPNFTGIGGPNFTGIGGPNFTGIGGPNFTGIGGPNFTGIGGPNFTGIGGPNFTGIGGPNFTGIGGPNFTGIGGPNFTGIGGANRSFNAPIRSADAQVVVYSTLGFFEDNGLETLQVLGRVPGLDTHPWLAPVGQAYAVELDPAITAPRVIGFNYLQRDVPEGYEHTLAIYFMPEGEESWQRLDSVRYVENLVVSDLQEQNGTYAIMSTLVMPELVPGWNLIVYPLPDPRPISDALASLAGRATIVYESEQAGERPPAAAETNVPHLEFAHLYWVWLEGDDQAPFYLAPPLRSPEGIVPGN